MLPAKPSNFLFRKRPMPNPPVVIFCFRSYKSTNTVSSAVSMTLKAGSLVSYRRQGRKFKLKKSLVPAVSLQKNVASYTMPMQTRAQNFVRWSKFKKKDYLKPSTVRQSRTMGSIGRQCNQQRSANKCQATRRHTGNKYSPSLEDAARRRHTGAYGPRPVRHVPVAVQVGAGAARGAARHMGDGWCSALFNRVA